MIDYSKASQQEMCPNNMKKPRERDSLARPEYNSRNMKAMPNDITMMMVMIAERMDDKNLVFFVLGETEAFCTHRNGCQ